MALAVQFRCLRRLCFLPIWWVEPGTFDLWVIGATGYAVNAYRKEANQRFDVEDAQSILLGSHEYKIGVDARGIASTYYNLPYASSFIFNGVDPTLNGGLLYGEAVNSIISAMVPKVYPTFLQLGTYAQDTWKAGNGFTLTYGARYDINPAPRARSGPKPYAIDGNGFLTTNLPIYTTQWKNISPRVGVSYQIDQTPGKELAVRAGFGMFYDTSYGSLNSAFNSAPYQSSSILTNPAFPTTLTNQQAPRLGTMPFGVVYGADSSLQAPRILEYHVAVDRNLGRNQVVTLSFVSSSSTSVTQSLSTPAFTSQYDLLNQVTGSAISSIRPPRSSSVAVSPIRFKFRPPTPGVMRRTPPRATPLWAAHSQRWKEPRMGTRTTISGT